MINWKRIFKRYLVFMMLVFIPLCAYIVWNGRIPSRYMDDQLIYSRLSEESDFGMKWQFADGGWVRVVVYSSNLSLDVYNAEAYLLFDDGCRLKLEFISQYRDFAYKMLRLVEPSTKQLFRDHLGEIFESAKIIQSE